MLASIVIIAVAFGFANASPLAELEENKMGMSVKHYVLFSAVIVFFLRRWM